MILRHLPGSDPQYADKKKINENAETQDEATKVSVIPHSNAVVDEGTVVVENHYTVIASAAMVSQRWLVNLASKAISALLYGIHFYISVHFFHILICFIIFVNRCILDLQSKLLDEMLTGYDSWI